jgi:hypothetical protein
MPREGLPNMAYRAKEGKYVKWVVEGKEAGTTYEGDSVRLRSCTTLAPDS